MAVLADVDEEALRTKFHLAPIQDGPSNQSGWETRSKADGTQDTRRP